MRPIGHRDQGVRRLAERVMTCLRDHGQVAVLLSRSTGNGAAIAYTDRSYEWHMRRQAEHLVGVYRDDLGDGASLYEQIVNDMAAHLGCAPKAKKVRA